MLSFSTGVAAFGTYMPANGVLSALPTCRPTRVFYPL